MEEIQKPSTVKFAVIIAAVIVCCVVCGVVIYISGKKNEAVAERYESQASVEDQEKENTEDSNQAQEENQAEDQEEGQSEDQTEEQAENGGDNKFIIMDSSSRYLDRRDLARLSKEELKLARNEIYARHGRKFDDPNLQEYFNSQSWYKGTVEPADFTESMLNSCEVKNVQLISDYEVEMGYK